MTDTTTTVPATPPGGLPITRDELTRAGEVLDRVTRAFEAKVVGQTGLRDSLLVALMTGGHVLLESVPGLAKTTAAQTLAAAVDASFRRIQCTPDLLPSDITGVSIFDRQSNEFEFKPGPVFANIVIGD